VAVVVVCHDSADDLPATLDALLGQLEPGDELVCVDNPSRRPSAALVRAAMPAATIVCPRTNVGFAGGAALGARSSRAPLMLFLNPDAIPGPDCIRELRTQAAHTPDWGAWQALVLQPSGALVNSCGNPVHFTGLAWAGGHDHAVTEIDGVAGETASVSGAALMVRRAAWEAVGGFEARYFMYGEDVDLSLRLRLSGWRVGVTPTAQVEHGYAFGKGDYKWFHLERNRWWTVLTTYPTSLLLLVAPALVALEACLLAVAWRGGWLTAKLRAHVAVLRSLRFIIRRRRGVQASAQVDAAAFASALSAELDSPFLGAAGRSSVLRLLLRAYWEVVRLLLR
jgi:GT2 family glycosyltransferase